MTAPKSAKPKRVVPRSERKWLDYDGAAAYLSIGRRAVEQLAHDGELLKITGITNKALFDRADLDAYADRKKAASS